MELINKKFMSIGEIIKLHNSCFDYVVNGNTAYSKRKPIEEITNNQAEAKRLIDECSKEELKKFIIDQYFSTNFFEW